VAWCAYDVSVDKVDSVYFSPLVYFMIIYMALRHTEKEGVPTFKVQDHKFVGSNPSDWAPNEVVAKVRELLKFCNDILINKYPEVKLTLPKVCNPIKTV
jgi:hypothetical protein